MSPRARVTAAAVALAAVLVTTGTLHFASPHGFESIVPSLLGSPAFWVRLSGVGELACAVGLLIARTRQATGWATAVLFVLVFPANIEMAVQAWQGHGSQVIAYARLPLQIPLVLWPLYIAGDGLGRYPNSAPAANRSSSTGGRPPGALKVDPEHTAGGPTLARAW